MQKPKKSVSTALVIAVISVPIFIGALDLTVISAVLPHVLLDLEIPISDFDDAAWLVTGYLLAYTVSMTFMGRLSDIHGRRKIFLFSLVVFMVGSYLIAISGGWPTRTVMSIMYRLGSGRLDPAKISLAVLIGCRIIQAFGAGAMVPVGMAFVADLFPAGKRARPLGIIAAVDTAGWVVGHLYGGIIVSYWPWQTIFWLNIPICIIAYIAITRVLKGFEKEKSAAKMDWVGALLVTLSLTAFIVGLGTSSDASQNASLGSSSGLPPYALQATIIAVLFMGIFIYRQINYEFPLINLTLFKRANFSLAIIANFFVGFGLFIAIANVPLFINTLKAVTPEQGAWDSGWVLSALTIPMAFAAFLGGWLTEKTNYRLPAIVGLVAVILAFNMMTGWQQNTAYATMIPQLLVAGIGFGLTLAPIASAVVNASPDGYRGTGSALVIIFRLLGMTAGVSSITTYGLKRIEVLSAKLLPTGAGLSELAQVGITATEMVISETFLIAGSACLLALLPILFLRKNNKLVE